MCRTCTTQSVKLREEETVWQSQRARTLPSIIPYAYASFAKLRIYIHIIYFIHIRGNRTRRRTLARARECARSLCNHDYIGTPHYEEAAGLIDICELCGYPRYYLEIAFERKRKKGTLSESIHRSTRSVIACAIAMQYTFDSV